MSETVVFSRELYSLEAVKQAAQDYAELASFQVSDGGADIIVEIAEIDPDVQDVLLDEFCNQALSEVVIRRNQEPSP